VRADLRIAGHQDDGRGCLALDTDAGLTHQGLGTPQPYQRS
jgi:hypothetical protein